MAAPALATGTYVQLNPSTESSRSAAPSSIEKTVGVIRQAYFVKGEPYYQVVWNPGDARPRVAMYHGSELTALSAKQAQSDMQQVASGSPLSLSTQSSQYQQPFIPSQALPPSLQGVGNVEAEPPTTLTPGH